MFKRYICGVLCCFLMHAQAAAQSLNTEVNGGEDSLGMEEIIDLGFIRQQKDHLAGSISVVTGSELAKTPMPNLSSTFAGRFSGLLTNETSSEWARVKNQFWVRGGATGEMRNPIIIVDGLMILVRPELVLEYINPNEINTVAVLKDASTLALYGISGADGAIVISTKRGRIGKLEVNGRVDYSLQELSERPRTLNAFEYVSLRNQAAYNDNNALGKFQLFPEEVVNAYTAGGDPEHYPDNNWFDRYINRFAHVQRSSLNMQGGGEKVTFFSNVNFMNQTSNFIVEKNEKYKPDPLYRWINFRTNVDAKLNSVFRAYLNVAGNAVREKTTDENMADTYTSIFEMPPIIYDVTPVIIDPNTGDIIHPGGEVVTSINSDASNSTYGRLNRQGYRQHTATNIYSNFGLEADLNQVIKGLKVLGNIGFQTNSPNTLGSLRDYERWTRDGDWNELMFQKKGTNEHTPLTISKVGRLFYNLNYQVSGMYDRRFGNHQVSGYLYGMFQKYLNGDPLLYKRIYTGAIGTYVFDNRYVVTLGTGYSGSDNFARGRRFHATPAVAAAWIASNEHFFDQMQWLEFLKLKASYGINGNDQTGVPRYGYLDNISGVTEVSSGNPLYEPEKVHKTNIGIETKFKNGVSVAAEWYALKTDNLMINNTAYIPAYNGLVSSFPLINGGSAENTGVEIELGYDKQVNDKLSVSTYGYLNIGDNKIQKAGENLRTSDYVYGKRVQGFPIGQAWGYQVDYSNGNGFFNSQTELDDYLSTTNYAFGNPRVGDLKYVDLNEDGVVDEKDQVPIGYGILPRYTFGFQIGLTYRAFSFSALFNGRAKIKNLVHGNAGFYESAIRDGLYSPTHLSAWTEERYENGEPILHPALSLVSTTTNAAASDFFVIDRSYVRLRNVEVSYQLPASVVNAIDSKEIRVFVSGHNLITWDRLGDYEFGPENHYNTLSPARVFNFGVNVSF
ncbi:MAG TPA: SusC/RagA family TonB-linked outer membrane protein [Parapedobacter sp.]|uniref:SusC/RagA family TonB-linked outer membrane protein n=1 Tax=Parapedobacter sp. TaxID=1958893 RepID=UPI002CBDA7C8|nr:SusC/RagA family TonB-linked outer membrane protein [Parapedobacter sp.]HWK56801.1 SusC/RagA family TonB-linked outer membrane protein [Parapedobacter sp.]